MDLEKAQKILDEKKVYVHPVYFLPHRQVLEDTLAIAIDSGEEDIRILDAGSGTGLTSFLYAKLLEDIGAAEKTTIIGLDVDRESIDVSNFLKDNPAQLAGYLQQGIDKTRINSKDSFFNDWLRELRDEECGYLTAVSFLNGDAGNEETMNNLGEFDAIIFPESFHDFDGSARRNVIEHWNRKGPMVVSTSYPRDYRAKIAEYAKEPLAFGVLYRQLFLNYTTFEYLPGELMLAIPTSRTDLPDVGKSYVFDVLSHLAKNTLETGAVHELAKDPTKKEYGYFEFNPDFAKANLPIELKKDPNNLPRGHMIYDSRFNMASYGLLVETKDVTPDAIKCALASGGVSIGFVPDPGLSGNFYQISIDLEDFSLPFDEMISCVDSIAKQLYVLENSKITVTLR